MNKPNKPNTRLPVLANAPERSDLQTMLEMAQRYQGELIEASWVNGESANTLTVVIPKPPTQASGKSSGARDPEWRLSTKDSATKPQTEVWTNKTSDLEFIGNLLAVSSGPSAPAPPLEPGQKMFTSTKTASVPKPSATSAPQPQASEETAKAVQKTGDTNLGMVLSGDLSEIDLTGILQSISLLRMTGCLEVHSQMDEVFLFFEEGMLVHALYETTLGAATVSSGAKITGHGVLLELLLWDAGQFNFKPNKKTNEKTVDRRLEGLLMEGATLLDYWKYLIKSGMNLDSVLSRCRADLSRTEFESTVTQGLPIDLTLQANLYLEINGKRSIQDIVTKFSLPRFVWVPAIFNMHNSNLIGFSSVTLTLDGKPIIPLVPDDMSLSKAKRSLIRIESGMMSYDLFAHFLKLEFERAKRINNHFFSVLIFSVYNAQNREPLSVLAISHYTEFIEKEKESLDLLAHYRENDYIILCPNRDPQQTAWLAEKIANSLKQCQPEGQHQQDLLLAFGVAGFPQTSTNIEQLLSFAEEAKNAAKSEGKSIRIAPSSSAAPVGSRK